MASNIRKIIKQESIDSFSINDELQQLWKLESEKTSYDDKLPITKVCTINLIIYLSSKDRLNSFTSMIDSAIEKIPLKVIYLINDDDIVEPKARISGSCKIVENGGVQVCCEQIFISAASTDLDILASTAVDNINPDLPVVLLWLSKPDANNKLLNTMALISDRIIINSGELKKLAEISDINTLLKKFAGVEISDIAWNSISFWQEFIADSFDIQSINEYANQIDKIEIKRNRESDMIQSIYLSGWLAFRLGWDLTRVEKSDVNDEIQIKFEDMNNRQKSVDIEIGTGNNSDIYNINSVIFNFNNKMNLEIKVTENEKMLIFGSESLQTPDILEKSTIANLDDNNIYISEIMESSSDNIYKSSFDIINLYI